MSLNYPPRLKACAALARASRRLYTKKFARGAQTIRGKTLKPGEQAAFAYSGFDQYGQPFAVPAVSWFVSAGSITPEGVYTASATGGLHTVRATAGDREAIVEVRITTDQLRPDEGDDKMPIDKPGKRVLRWRGTVPPQKWMNFYTKVLTRFAASPELRLEVSFEASIDSDQAQSKVDEA